MKRALFVALFLTAARLSAAGASCAPSPARLCLNGGRFAAQVTWKDFQGNTGTGQAVSLSGDTGYFWFFSANNVELVVKVLDGRGFNSSYWVFYGALSTVEYTLTVTDTVNGAVRTYFNPSTHLGSIADTAAFPVVGSARAEQARGSATARRIEDSDAEISRRVQEGLREVASAASTTCAPTPSSLCLNQGRFRAEVTWRDFQGNKGAGQAVALTSDTGYFWFFDSANVELVVKILDGRALNQDFWVFFGALSTVEYELKVTDTVSGRTRYYFNPSDKLASVADTSALGDSLFVHALHDPSRAVTELVPTSGGTISTVGSDGSTFTLEIPPDALLSAEMVTLTPVSSIQGIPLSGGLAAGVHVEPEGLALYETATLTIVPAAPVARDQAITFSYQGEGAEFFLAPALPLGSQIKLPVLHFTGYGIGRGTQADIDTLARQRPTLVEDQLSQTIAAVLLPQMRRGAFGNLAAGVSGAHALGARAACPPGLADAFRRMYADTAVPAITSAVGDCDDLRLRLPYLRFFIKYVGDMGCDAELDREVTSIRDVIRNEVKRCYNQAFEKCLAKDPKQPAEMERWIRDLGPEGIAEVDLAKFERCRRFEIAFDSRIHQESDEFGSILWKSDTHVATPARIQIRKKGNFNSGSGALSYLSADFSGHDLPNCTDTFSPATNSTFAAYSLEFTLTTVLDYVPTPPPVLTFGYNPGDPTERGLKVCTDPPSEVLSPEQFVWRDAYAFTHFDEKNTGVEFPYFTDLLYIGSREIYGGKLSEFPLSTFSGEAPYSQYRHMSEHTTIKLFHTPE